MSGIFRRHNSMISQSSQSTPTKRRVSLSPFCTSPGQLQDVTMDSSYAIGYRSPCVSLQQYNGGTSPTQGCSVREVDEKIAQLRKENFNLKLRIYFLEEKLPGYSQLNTADGQESLMKQCIDSKVEIEVLKKEVQEKQELIVNAAQAMNHMEKLQKDAEQRFEGVIDELNQKITYLEMENKELEKTPILGICNNIQYVDQLGLSDISEERLREVDGSIKQYEENLKDLTDQIRELEEQLNGKNKYIEELKDKVQNMNFQNQELAEQLQNKEQQINSAESQKLREELLEQKRQLADKMCMLDDTEVQLRATTIAHEKSKDAVRSLMITIQGLTEENDELKHINSTRISYGKEMTSTGCGTSISSLGRSLSDTECFSEISCLKSKYEDAIKRKDEEIKKLNSEIKKKTFNLQNLVNKELWEKNREIERLTKIINNKTLDTTLNTSGGENMQLEKSFTETEYHYALERNKYLQLKVDKLIQRLAAHSSSDLESNTIIEGLKKELIESKEDTLKAEKWRKECSDICTVLTSRLEELAGFLDSLLRHKEIFSVLGSDRRRAMRKAIDRSLDLSRSLNPMSLSVSNMSIMDYSLPQLSNISGLLDLSANKENKTFNSHNNDHLPESESKAINALQAEVEALRKELEKPDSKKQSRKSIEIENPSESEAWSEPDRKVSFARIGLEEPLSLKAVKTLDGNETADTEDGLDQRRSKSRTMDKISQLEDMISKRDNKLLEAQCELVNVDNRLQKESLRVIEISRDVENYRKLNESLQSENLYLKSQCSNFDEIRIEYDYLKRQIVDKNNLIERIQVERDRLSVEAKVAEIQIDNLKKAMEEMKVEHNENVQKLALEEKEVIREIVGKMNDKLREKETQYQETLSRDWVAKTVYNDLERQLESQEKMYSESQGTINFLMENETEMKNHLIENEKSMRALKKSLDEATIQASKTIQDRTKALTEKLQLERTVDELNSQMVKLSQEKMSLMTLTNQLQDKILNTSSSADESKNRALRYGENINSGYTSEDVPNNHGISNQAQRIENSSPDLGIESDAGRVPSANMSNIHKDMFKIVEISTSKLSEESKEELEQILKDVEHVSNVPINKQKPVEEGALSSSSGIHDCAKVEAENAELRRKLIRNRRSFEQVVSKLKFDNQRKEQVERDIKNQLLKTHKVLQNARSNIENELK